MSIMSTKLAELVANPINQINQRAMNLSPEERRDIAHETDELVQRLAWIGQYLTRIEAGDEHAAALKAANKRCRRIRKELGFAYPESGLADSSF
jgi:hypothetical protein